MTGGRGSDCLRAERVGAKLGANVYEHHRMLTNIDRTEISSEQAFRSMTNVNGPA